MKQKSVLFLLLLASEISAGHILTFFFVPFSNEDSARHMANKFKKPHAVAKRSLLNLGGGNPIEGIFSTYYGFLNVSDSIGQTSFPLRQSKKPLTVITTQKISPIMMFNNTVSHWELVPGSPAAAYTFAFKEDKETKLSLWEVSQAAVPENGQIPPTDTLIILAKPKNIYVPLGATLAAQDANLKLPNILARRGINTVRNALFMLNISFLFRPVDLLYKKEKTRYGTLLAE